MNPKLVVICYSTSVPDYLHSIFLKPIEDNESTFSKHAFSWFLETKYYTAEIDVTILKYTESLLEDEVECIEGLILHFDPKVYSQNSLKLQLEKTLQSTDLEVKIITVNNISVYDSSSTKYIGYLCKTYGFELVDLNCKVTDEESGSIGVERINELLFINQWSNLILTKGNVNLQDKLQNDDSCETVDSFEKFASMLSELNITKNNVHKLSTDERKKQAEKVVNAFWKAIGGDDSEISDDE